jgi:hypothetical protein
MSIKRRLLEQAVQHDPEPGDFEAWLWDRCVAESGISAAGPVRAMALAILAEWQLARQSAEFRDWLAAGAPSADAEPS